jgi:hypothetical protein
MSERVVELARRLEAIGEEIGDLAMECLRQALEAGETKPPSAERRLSQARRAVERAVAALSEAAKEA